MGGQPEFALCCVYPCQEESYHWGKDGLKGTVSELLQQAMGQISIPQHEHDSSHLEKSEDNTDTDNIAYEMGTLYLSEEKRTDGIIKNKLLMNPEKFLFI